MESREHVEKQILGAMLISPQACEESFALLRIEDFGDAMNGMIFESMSTIFDGEKLDLGTVLQFVKNTKVSGGEVLNKRAALYLAQCMEAVIHAGDIRYYCQTLLRMSARCQIHAAAKDWQMIATDADIHEVGEMLSRCQGVLSELEKYCIRDTESVKSLREINSMVRDELKREDSDDGGTQGEPLTSGLCDLDEIVQFYPGQLITIAARPSDGKTALACNIADHMARRGKHVLFFSFEMSCRQIHMRLACGIAGIDSTRYSRQILTADEKKLLLQTLDDLDHCSIWIDDAPKITVNELVAKSRLHRRKRGLDCVIVDYLTLLKPANERAPEHERVGTIAKDLKSAAKTLNVPIIAMAQLNRDNVNEKREPRLSDLRGSGEIEQATDTAIFIHQTAEPSALQGAKIDEGFPAVLKVEKQRNGRRGRIDVIWFPVLTMFANRAAKHMDNYEPSFAAWNDPSSNGHYEF